MANNEQKIEIIINGKNYVAKPVGEATEAVDELGKSVKTTQLAVATATGKIAADIGEYIGRKCVDALRFFTTGAYDVARAWGNAVNDINDKTGMFDEASSRILSVAKIAGVSADDMGQALMLMSKNVQDNAEVFAKWGIAIQNSNGDLLSAEEIYNNVLIKHREMANGMEKNAMEMELFGRAGGKFNDLLNLSDAQLQQWNQTLEHSGLILRGDVSQAIEDTEQRGRLLDAAVEGLQVQVGNALNPALDTLYTELLNNINAMYADEQRSKDLKEALEGLTNFAVSCAKGFASITNAIMDAVVWMGKFMNSFGRLPAGIRMGMEANGEFVPNNWDMGEWEGDNGFDYNPTPTPTPGLPQRTGVVVPSVAKSGSVGNSIKKAVDNTKQLESAMRSIKINLMKQLGLDTTMMELENIQIRIDELKAQNQDVSELNDLLDRLRQNAMSKDDKQAFHISWVDAFKATEDSFKEFGNDILTASKSLSRSFIDLFKNLANNVLGMVMNTAFGGLSNTLFGGGGGVSGALSAMSKEFVGGLPHKAGGGLASGWTVVGEKGPELVNFSNPARVYTAQQTSAMLGGNGAGDVRVIIENRSGQDVKATQTTADFDAQGMILNVVLEAAANNYDGFAQTMGGALSAWR